MAGPFIAHGWGTLGISYCRTGGAVLAEPTSDLPPVALSGVVHPPETSPCPTLDLEMQAQALAAPPRCPQTSRARDKFQRKSQDLGQVLRTLEVRNLPARPGLTPKFHLPRGFLGRNPGPVTASLGA